jgi:integrase
MKRARYQAGSVVFDKRRDTWAFLWREDGKRRSRLIGTKAQYPTKAAARKAAERIKAKLAVQMQPSTTLTAETSTTPLVKRLVAQYREERMPTRKDTRRSYEVWLNNHILPRWGQNSITELQARPVEVWLRSLLLASKSKVHIRGLIRVLWDYAMWREEVPSQRNPMELVSIPGASKRRKQPRSLTVEEFQRFAQHLREPFRTLAVLCVCFGLRISECLALKWADVDWLNARLRIERGIVAQEVDETKTDESHRQLPMDDSILEALKRCRLATQFQSSVDWVFPSPVQHGRLPWSYDQIWRVYQKAAAKAGLGRLGTHAMRHTYRSWLDAVGTPIAVQQKLMRHADIRTTMNVYGDVVTDEMREAQERVVKLALPESLVNGSQVDRK